jgi:bacteriochlorophyllide a dehydrogenase
MLTTAVVFAAPEAVELRELPLEVPAGEHVVVEVEWSGISTGTERLLFSGKMPPFPGMGYPLVPGYETVGRVVEGTPAIPQGSRVFVPGASCFGPVRGLFGGSASRLAVPVARVTPLDGAMDEAHAEQGVLLALAATARHALAGGDGRKAELIVGHGVLGRLLARLAVAAGGEPTVWETNPVRAEGAQGYRVVAPSDDARRDYGCIVDVSGDAQLLDELVGRTRKGGEVVLAGFYSDRVSFNFAPAFIREVRLRVAAEWRPEDLVAVMELLRAGTLSLDGLITHRRPATQAAEAYAQAFGDPRCLKMLLTWRSA